MTDGYIYCFSNQSMAGILKVGMTERTPEIRLGEANVSDTWRPPTPYKIEFAKKVSDASGKEKTIHTLLEQYTERINPRREFFRVSLEEVRKFFDLMDGEMWSETRVEEDEEEDEDEEDTNQRRLHHLTLAKVLPLLNMTHATEGKDMFEITPELVAVFAPLEDEIYKHFTAKGHAQRTKEFGTSHVADMLEIVFNTLGIETDRVSTRRRSGGKQHLVFSLKIHAQSFWNHIERTDTTNKLCMITGEAQITRD